MFSLALPLFVGLCARVVFAQCESFGTDIMNGGTYYINVFSPIPFSFTSGFMGVCTTNDFPILQLPYGVQLNCSEIAEVANTIATSTCPINHAHMSPGLYTVIFPNIGAQRQFTIVVSQTTVTATPTVTITSTPIALTTATITSTVTDMNTLVFLTTVPVTSGTSTFTPHTTVTSTTTSTATQTHKTVTNTKITTTLTETATCIPRAASMDSRMGKKVGTREEKTARRALVRRDGPDGPATTTVTEVTSEVSTTIVVPTTTITNSVIILVTTTSSTTSTSTVLSGTVKATITAPTPTRTVTTYASTTVTSTITNAITVMKKTAITPAAVSMCLKQGGQLSIIG